MPGTGTLDTRAGELIALLVEGKTHREIAALVSTKSRSYTHQAVSAFAKRHAAAIATAKGGVAAATIEVAIRAKAERIRRLGALADGMQEIIDTRGLLAAEPKFIGSGKYGREEMIVRFDSGLVREYRAALRDVAEELGDMPKPDINIDNRTQTAVIVFNAQEIDGIRRPDIIE